MPEQSNYVPVPVEAAREIADRFNKHIVAVVAFDRAHGQTTHEDFRLRTAAQWAEERELLRKACIAAGHAIDSLLAVREGISDEVLTRVRAAIGEALNHKSAPAGGGGEGGASC